MTREAVSEAEPVEPANHDEAVDEVLTARQAARLLKISHDLLYESAGRGELPHRRLGRRMLFSRVALIAWLRASGEEALRARRTRRVRRADLEAAI